MALDYAALRAKAKDVIVNTFGGIACKVYFLDNTFVNSNIVFDEALFANVDNRQNPTTLGALARQVAYLPGDLGFDPDVGTRIEYKIGLVTHTKRVDSFKALTPTNVACLYEVTLVNG